MYIYINILQIKVEFYKLVICLNMYIFIHSHYRSSRCRTTHDVQLYFSYKRLLYSYDDQMRFRFRSDISHSTVCP